MSEPKRATPESQEAVTARAMKLKAKPSSVQHPSAGQTPNEGMKPIPNSEIAPSGAFDAEGQRPVLERSRKAR